MEYFVLTEEHLRNVTTYLPITEKIEFVEEVATLCFDTLKITVSDSDTLNAALPPMKKENTFNKSRFLMGMLIKGYLGIDFEPVEGTKYLMDAVDYDRFAGGHILNQIERFKSNAELRDTCFDILQDYRDLEKRLNTEIYGLLQCMNDPATRIIASMQALSSSDMMQKSINDIKGLQEEIEELAAKAKAEE